MSRIGNKLDEELQLMQITGKKEYEKVELMPINKIKLNPQRVRRQINREEIALMAKNVKTFGILQPLLINEKNEVILGNRRLEAAKLASLTKVPVIKRPIASYESIEKELVSDLHSKHLSVIERAVAFQRLIEIKEISKYALANYLGLSHNLICRTLAILQANKTTLKLIKDGKISQRVVAMVLYRLKDKSLEDYVMQEIMRKNLNVVQAGNFVAELNDPETFKKHFIKQLKAFKTSMKNYKKKLSKITLSEKQNQEIKKQFQEIKELIR